MTRKVSRMGLILLVVASIVACTGILASAGDPVHSFEWRGADLRDSLRHVGRVFNVNIVLDQKVKGEVTMSLNDVTCEQAIQYLVRSNGFNYRKNGSCYIVGEERALKESFDVTTTKVFHMDYADAKSVAEEIGIVVSKFKVDQLTNSIIVIGTPLELQNVQEIISLIDIEAPQVAIEARLEEMSEDAKRELGLQVSVSGGITWDVSHITLPNVDVKLKALQQQNKSRTIARPNIATLNGQTGKILVGDRVPVKISNTDKDGNVTSSVMFIDVGVKLSITPRVNRNGEISLDLKPEVSTITSMSDDGLPAISTREVETMLRAKDGETIIIGGLLRQTDIETIYKLPLLGDLPVLGKLFQFKSKSTAPQSELVFFITPRIMPGGSHPQNQNPATPKNTQPGGPQTSSNGTSTPPVTPQPGTTENVPPVSEQSPNEEPVVVVVPAEETIPATNPTEPVKPETPLTPTDTPTGNPQPVNPETPVNPTLTPQPGVQVTISETTYTVQKGDTLFAIARKYGIPIETLYGPNNFAKDTKLSVGQQVRVPIPKDHVYTIKPGETLWRIAKRYGLTLDLLCEINGIQDPTRLSVGQAIILPCKITDVKDDRY